MVFLMPSVLYSVPYRSVGALPDKTKYAMTFCFVLIVGKNVALLFITHFIFDIVNFCDWPFFSGITKTCLKEVQKFMDRSINVSNLQWQDGNLILLFSEYIYISPALHMTFYSG